jgi:hypothetical protein
MLMYEHIHASARRGIAASLRDRLAFHLHLLYFHPKKT